MQGQSRMRCISELSELSECQKSLVSSVTDVSIEPIEPIASVAVALLHASKLPLAGFQAFTAKRTKQGNR